MNENYLNCIEGEKLNVEHKEEDLDGFRVTCSSRLSPEGALGFMIGTIVYVSVMMFFLLVL